MKIRFIGFILMAIVGFFLLSTTYPKAYMAHPFIGKNVVDVMLENAQSQQVSLKSMLKDKKSIIVFWTTWCPYCRTTIKDLVQRREDFQQNQVQIVLINIAENKNKVLSLLKDLGVEQSFTILFDVEQVASEKYEVQGIPTILFVTQEGIVSHLDGRVPAEYMNILSKKY